MSLFSLKWDNLDMHSPQEAMSYSPLKNRGSSSCFNTCSQLSY